MKIMFKPDDAAAIKAIMICHKKFLKTNEAMLYTSLGRTQLNKRAAEYGIFKSETGYYKKEDLDRMLAGIKESPDEALQRLRQNQK